MAGNVPALEQARQILEGVMCLSWYDMTQRGETSFVAWWRGK